MFTICTIPHIVLLMYSLLGELDASVAQDEIHKRQLDVQEKVQKQQHMVDELQRQPGLASLILKIYKFFCKGLHS